MNDRAWQHRWLRVQRLIRSILAVRRDELTRPVLKLTLRDALKERERIRRAGWFS